jgi:hypothetical protein
MIKVEDDGTILLLALSPRYIVGTSHFTRFRFYGCSMHSGWAALTLTFPSFVKKPQQKTTTNWKYS